jgi:hypothetical protein
LRLISSNRSALSDIEIHPGTQHQDNSTDGNLHPAWCGECKDCITLDLISKDIQVNVATWHLFKVVHHLKQQGVTCTIHQLAERISRMYRGKLDQLGDIDPGSLGIRNLSNVPLSQKVSYISSTFIHIVDIYCIRTLNGSFWGSL